MSRYSDQVRDEYGRTVPGVSIYVYKWDADADAAGDLETLTDDLSAPLGNPLTSDADGLFYFNSVDGQKLIEYHYGGKVEFRDLILVGDLPVPQAVFGGLLVNANALTIPTGMDMIGTDGADALDHGGANYVAGTAPTARSGFTSSNARAFVLSKEQIITPQMFYQATDPDAQNMMEAARDYLATFGYNENGGGFYGGAPKLVAPAGPTYDMHARVDFAHTGKFEGEGDSYFGPGSGGCTHFKFTGTTSGFGIQGTNTNGITGTDVTSHAGSGGFEIADMCLEGDYSGTEGDYHALVCRIATRARNLYLPNWRGEGIKAWAGNVNGASNVGGNLSISRFDGIKTENCRGGIDIRGSDANIITTINCQGYQNRQFGLLDDNGAGSNTHIGWHCASNGLISNVTGPYTQCSFGGNRYAAKWGGDFTIAPSGTTADTANWLYIEAGGVIANLIPAHAATVGLFRAGGDYAVLNNAGVYLLNCYSEGGGFSQFSPLTVISGGTIGDQYYRGGNRTVARAGGVSFANTGAATLYLDSLSGGEGSIVVRNGASFTELGFIDISTGGVQLSAAAGNVYFKLGGTFVANIDPSGNYAGTGSVKSSAPGAGVGYATGAGAAVTQLTNKSTATPAINKVCGQVTMNNAALAASAKVSFVVTNSTVAATDTIIVSIASGGTANAYRASVTAISAGVSFTVTVENITGGSLSEAPVINFAILKAVAA